ncbi:MAG: helix-turn-helix transcriptional regulator [Bacilli bacterium]|jgi:transcriptional regulator with XRE-family HTH domain
MIDFVQVGIKIQSLRQASSMSQDSLAERLYVTRQALSRWETGVSAPSIDTIIELGTIFNVPFEEILCLGEEMKVDRDDIFRGHTRDYIMRKILSGELEIDVTNEINRFTIEERILILKHIKDGKIECDIRELCPYLTAAEQRMLGFKGGI